MKQTGILLEIGVKIKRGAPMQLLENVTVSENSGISNDYRGKSEKRQVTVLSDESWESVCTVLSANLDWTNRRANLLISGIKLQNSKGRLLKIGNVTLEITGETTPCKLMDENYPGLKNALEPNWNGGVTCKVVKGGKIKKGDNVTL